MADIWIMSSLPARRDWLLRAVGNEPAIRVAGTAATFPFLRSLIGETSADLALIDLQSSTESSVVHDWLIELLDIVTILLLSSEPEPVIFNRMLHAKSGGLVSADAPPEQLVQAIKAVASGLMIFDGALTSALTSTVDNDVLQLDPLTTRESEVLGLLADGLGNKEIAARLSISEHTIKFHIRSILGKLGASSRTEAVSRGLRIGLIEL